MRERARAEWAREGCDAVLWSVEASEHAANERKGSARRRSPCRAPTRAAGLTLRPFEYLSWPFSLLTQVAVVLAMMAARLGVADCRDAAVAAWLVGAWLVGAQP